MNILLLEDDRIGPSLFARGIGELGHHVRAITDPTEVRPEIERRSFDLALIDHGLPTLDGFAMVRDLRAANHMLPILLRTAVDCPEERAAGLDAGADDCVSRPVAFVELVARCNALLRRSHSPAATTMLRAGDIEMNLLRREVRRAGRPIRLQPREFRMLEQLLRHDGRIVTKAMLLESVWGFDFDPRTNVVETQISRLRAKLNAGFEGDAIETVRSAGYMIRSPG